MHIGTRLIALAILLAGLTSVLSVNATAAKGNGGPGNCLAWDIAQYPPGEKGHPAIDRLAPDEPYGRLLVEWKADGCLRMNQVQALGTHNSYHLEPLARVLALVRQFNPQAAATFQYSHRPLIQQLDSLGVRQVELDVFADTAGGLFANPVGPILTGVPDPQTGMDAPGLKVLHIQDIDYRTTCKTFIVCLEGVRAWSDEHPGHLPILVLVEAKDDPLIVPVPIPIPPTAPEPFDAARLDRIDTEIRSVFGPDRLITPDDVRGTRDTLEEAVLKDGWPSLNETRGRVFFALDNEDAKRTMYLDGHDSLRGRVMFTSSPAGQPEAAFMKMNEPLAPGAVDAIQALVAQGYIVRTRADADTIEARFNLTARREAAMASGAQFVSTDYPEPDLRFSPYAVSIPGGAPARCNPIVSPPGCTASGLEQIEP